MENISDNKKFIKEFKSSSKQITYLLVGAIVAAIIILGVLKYLDEANSAASDPTTTSDNALRLEFTPKNFPTLQLGHYALWLKTEEQPEWTLFKRFNSIDNNLVSLDGSFFQQWQEIIEFSPELAKVTIEVEGDRDTIPSELTYVKAEFNTTSELKFTAINSNQIGDTSSFILATPTDGNSKVNEASGIWLIKDDRKSPALELPDISESLWSYQARVIDEEGNVMLMGSFTNPSGVDNNDKHSEQTAKGFSVPGEDLLTNLPQGVTGPLNLASGNYTLIISLEPGKPGEDFTSDELFLKIYETKIPLKAEATSNIGLKSVFTQPQLDLSVVD